ncbi:unnamed protein product [Prorocentrum cordatum]|uniref:Alpha-ketoglutarate-dependent dioxygenase AlkB-like domain-containing protein n=1 Tax=Prorocentrum cordatum TaxID=2364126 RepID=A0ABN9UPK8_9DINO|nr:unnamed protein product [Polarella glacialis]
MRRGVWIESFSVGPGPRGARRVQGRPKTSTRTPEGSCVCVHVFVALPPCRRLEKFLDSSRRAPRAGADGAAAAAKQGPLPQLDAASVFGHRDPGCAARRHERPQDHPPQAHPPSQQQQAPLQQQPAQYAHQQLGQRPLDHQPQAHPPPQQRQQAPLQHQPAPHSHQHHGQRPPSEGPHAPGARCGPAAPAFPDGPPPGNLQSLIPGAVAKASPGAAPAASATLALASAPRPGARQALRSSSGASDRSYSSSSARSISAGGSQKAASGPRPEHGAPALQPYYPAHPAAAPAAAAQQGLEPPPGHFVQQSPPAAAPPCGTAPAPAGHSPVSGHQAARAAAPPPYGGHPPLGGHQQACGHPQQQAPAPLGAPPPHAPPHGPPHGAPHGVLALSGHCAAPPNAPPPGPPHHGGPPGHGAPRVAPLPPGTPPPARPPGHPPPGWPAYCGHPPPLGYGRLDPRYASRRSRSRSRRRRKAARSGSGERPKKAKKSRPPPPKVGKDGAWELSQEEKGLKLTSRRGRVKLRDVSRRCFAAFLPSPINEARCREFFEKIRDGTEWLQPEGPLGPLPRKTSWMVRPGCSCTYRYGGVEVEPAADPAWMHELLGLYMPFCGITDPSGWPNGCNVNLYENGSHGVGWHSDAEDLFQGRVQDIRILSLSLGHLGSSISS